MINNELFRKTVEKSEIDIPRLSALTGIPQKKILALMNDDNKLNAVDIQALSSVLGMSNALRRNIFFNKNFPLD